MLSRGESRECQFNCMCAPIIFSNIRNALKVGNIFFLSHKCRQPEQFIQQYILRTR